MKKIHILLEDDVYRGIWEIVKRRFTSPTRKYHRTINEALREYMQKHREEIEE